MTGLFRDRTEAGKVLAPLLRLYAHRTDVVVLGLPTGGVPVALEVARKLHAPLETLLVRKLRIPGNERIVMGAVGSGGSEFRDRSTIAAFQVPADQIVDVVRRERAEIERRERIYGIASPFPSLQGKTVILVDDGIVTGATMSAAVRVAQLKRAAEVVIAAPVTFIKAAGFLQDQVSSVISILMPNLPFNLADYYRGSRTPTEEEVRKLLAHDKARMREPNAVAA